MKICANCCFVSDEQCCPVCGSKNLSEVHEDDFCLLTEKKSADCEVLTAVFDEKSIPYSTMPYGRGVETRLGLPLENYRVFVPFGYLEEAKNVISQIESEATEQIRSSLLESIEMLNISPKTEKKIIRKIKLPADKDIFEYCIDIIKTADKLADGGKISDCPKGGHYYFCYSANATLAINSRTYEILSVTINKL
ncbi:MAG: hypothetical protein K2N14_01170 [Clostridia bacterium]|nr:hypothetical protein [Clostridia bacterium]